MFTINKLKPKNTWGSLRNVNWEGGVVGGIPIKRPIYYIFKMGVYYFNKIGGRYFSNIKVGWGLCLGSYI